MSIERYTLLLRGVNVDGKNKVVMSELKAQLSRIGLMNVQSYINSGNLFFEAALPKEQLCVAIQGLLESTYPFEIPFALISEKQYLQAFTTLPTWWNAKAFRRNVLFFISEGERHAIEEDLRKLPLVSEAVYFTDIAVFWAIFDKDTYSQTSYHKS